MTDINNIKNSGEVASLRATNASQPSVASSARFSSASSITSTAQVTAVSNTKTFLESGQDPLEKAARAIEQLVPENGENTRLRINKDDDTGRFVYQNVDNDSGEVVSQFPPETILEIIAHYRSLEGLVVDDKA
ncbi:flagellar protein FlaG [Kordiimonas pumila]|uniref:Flagellar protein FlaG n=1 Tax=Kordiimonas pumila TaxID=2161677 RepID=A0ABV7D361_9PROT|nr:flagellar protein FlaG [Kordiimonas pumila]